MTPATRLSLVLGINLAMILALLLVGLLAHSLGVLASGADYLGDALGTALALAAVKVSARKPGQTRATSLAALANSTFLVIVTVSVAAAALHRLLVGAPAIHGVPVVIVSVIAAGAMVGCVLTVGDADGDLSVESVMLDSLADAAAAIGVAISGTIILATDGLYWLDSAVALVIAVVVGYHAVKLIRRVLADLCAKRELPTHGAS
jgi:cobalt-zinc-cadmium efflux system protein